MATIPEIRNRLLEGFSEKQADLLAHVVIEAHDDLDRAEFVEGLEGQLPDEELGDLMRADVIAAARQRGLRVITNGWLLPDAA